MFKQLTALALTAGLGLSSVTTSPARADVNGGELFVGVLAGVAALAIIDDAVNHHHYYPRPRYRPRVVVRPRVYVPVPRVYFPRPRVVNRYVYRPYYRPRVVHRRTVVVNRFVRPRITRAERIRRVERRREIIRNRRNRVLNRRINARQTFMGR
ncbi:MAG: hypothetical protein D6754_17185 [Alphaproteobacteria bacterium]|nr:MAG: hypothetical protein D6754_17185 [Alphaproteobacteria bacterium]